MGCNDSLSALQNISSAAQNIVNILTGKLKVEIVSTEQLEEIKSYGIWTEKRKGKIVSYEYDYTYAGSTVTMNLDFLKYASIKRIDQIWDDTTVKDISVRLMTVTTGLYTQIKAVLADANTSITISPEVEQEWTLPSGGRLQFYYANYTAGKKLKIVVVVEEL